MVMYNVYNDGKRQIPFESIMGLAVMLLAVAIVVGFKKEIRNKTIGFGGHIQVTNYDNNNTFEMNPIRMNNSMLKDIKAISGVRHVFIIAF